MNRCVRFAASIAVFGIVLAGCSQAQDGAGTVAESLVGSTSAIPTVLVLDSSGSMSEPEGDGSRMDAAKKAATGLVEALPDGAVLGLVAYGASTGGSDGEKAAGCADVKTLQRAVALDRETVGGQITGLAPSGFTPIGASLRHAAELLPTDGEVAIVLLSDGEDTCAPPPPCDVARELKQERPGLTISTVGFKTANEELACIASATGGLYLTADNTDQLVTRLVAAQNVSANVEALTPTGLRGVELGQSVDQIRAAQPDFPGLNEGSADGDRVVIVWMDCDWVFEGGVLTEIRPGPSGGSGASRTIDGLSPGAPVSKASELYGDAVEKKANPDGTMTSLFTASEQAGTAWRIGHTDETIKTIYLCKCLPKPGTAAPSSGNSGGEVVGGTTIKRIVAYSADGSLDTSVATLTDSTNVNEVVCEPMVGNPGFSGLSQCGNPQAGHPVAFCAVNGTNAICPNPHSPGTPEGFYSGTVVGPYSGTQTPVVGEVPWAVDLVNGSICTYTFPLSIREGFTNMYLCSDGTVLWTKDDQPPFAVSNTGWTGLVTEMDYRSPMNSVQVKTAYFIERQK